MAFILLIRPTLPITYRPLLTWFEVQYHRTSIISPSPLRIVSSNSTAHLLANLLVSFSIRVHPTCMSASRSSRLTGWPLRSPRPTNRPSVSPLLSLMVPSSHREERSSRYPFASTRTPMLLTSLSLNSRQPMMPSLVCLGYIDSIQPLTGELVPSRSHMLRRRMCFNRPHPKRRSHPLLA